MVLSNEIGTACHSNASPECVDMEYIVHRTQNSTFVQKRVLQELLQLEVSFSHFIQGVMTRVDVYMYRSLQS